MTIRFRPHHLLCMLTYIGKGYNPAFCKNYDDIINRLKHGEDIVIVTGPDDICGPLLDNDAPHCHEESVTVRDKQAAEAVTNIFGFSIIEGVKLTLDTITVQTLRRAFSDNSIRSGCGGCQWKALCDDIAGRGYNEVQLSG